MLPRGTSNPGSGRSRYWFLARKYDSSHGGVGPYTALLDADTWFSDRVESAATNTFTSMVDGGTYELCFAIFLRAQSLRQIKRCVTYDEAGVYTGNSHMAYGYVGLYGDRLPIYWGEPPATKGDKMRNTWAYASESLVNGDGEDISEEFLRHVKRVKRTKHASLKYLSGDTIKRRSRSDVLAPGEALPFDGVPPFALMLMAPNYHDYLRGKSGA